MPGDAADHSLDPALDLAGPRLRPLGRVAGLGSVEALDELGSDVRPIARWKREGPA